MNAPRIDQDGWLQITPISMDDGPDKTWIELSSEEKVIRVRAFMEQAILFYQRTHGLPETLRVDKSANLFADLD